MLSDVECGIVPRCYKDYSSDGFERFELAVRGLKTKITVNVAILLLLSAAITDILVVVVVQSVMMRDEVARSRIFIETIGNIVHADNDTDLGITDRQREIISAVLNAQSKLPTFRIVDHSSQSLYQHNSNDFPLLLLDDPLKEVIKTGQSSIQDLGFTWAVFWWHPKAILVATPIKVDRQLHGAAAAVVPLSFIYEKLRSYNNPILIYILINTTILTLVGLYRIFRLYLRPIERIVRQADEFFEDGDLFFAFRHEDNELNRLSSSLNRMLERISSDKQVLQDTVSSLERANEELKQAQQEIIRAEKMASVGRLAAGIAHEIGNPIGIVLGYLDMLKQNDLDPDDKNDFLKRTEEEVQRINTVIRQLLDLARPKDYAFQNISLHEVIEDIVGVMSLQPIMTDIQTELNLRAQNDQVSGNADQLRQVFLNLLLNAADAIRTEDKKMNGRIVVRTAVVDDDNEHQKPCLKLQFEDNGAGIGPEQIENIFDPFYTTKDPGKGTGLGLAVSFMIIEGLGGTIIAQSTLGQGTVFNIELPLA